MLFGWNKVGKKLHFIATCAVAVGTSISAFWILSANSWMQTPARICQGVFAAAAPILGRAVVRTIQHSGIATKTFTTASALFAWAPVVAPLSAGLLVKVYDWRAIFWALLAYVTGLLIYLIIRLPHQLKNKRDSNSQRAFFSLNFLSNKEMALGLIIAVLAFAGFFAQLSIADQYHDVGLHISIIVTLIASCFAIGGAASRIVLGYVSRIVALRVWASSIFLLAMAGIICALAVESALVSLALACLSSICAGAIMPIATFLSMGGNAMTAPRGLAILGAAKMGISGSIAYAIFMAPIAPFFLTASISFCFSLMTWILCFQLSDD